MRLLFSKLASRLVWLIVWGYRVTLAPFLGGQCRYHPTCSQYMLDAVERFGPMQGVWMGLKRISRCHPWGGSGIDHPTPGSPRKKRQRSASSS